MSGKFITFEGSEGAGKTTQIAAVKTHLEEKGITTITTREPGGTEVAERIRQVLLDAQLTRMHEDTELLLMFAARAEHLQQLILPSLKQGTWVLCDRFTDASYAYQGYGRGIELERLAVLENWVQGTLRPDLVIVFDVDVETGLQRAAKRSEKDRMELEALSFFKKVRQGYLQRAADQPGRYRVIDAEQSIDRVRSSVIDIIDNWMKTAGITKQP